MKLTNTLLALAMSSLAITGCSSSSDSATPTPDGLYTGSITGGYGDFPDGPSGDEKAVIIDNRVMVFSSVVNSPLDPQQMFDASIIIDGSTFAGDAKIYDNNLATTGSVTFNATYITNESVTIQFTDPVSSTIPEGTINLTYSTDLNAKGSNLSFVNATWNALHGGLGNSTTMTINNNGSLSGSDDSCAFTGSTSPISTDKNLYNFSITTASTCSSTFASLDPNTTYSGYAWTEIDNSMLNLVLTDGVKSRFASFTK